MLKKNFSEEDMKAFEPAEKVGIIATVTPEGLPHITLLTSVMASTPSQLTIGEFSKGVSKDYMQITKKMGFAVLTMDKRLWRGKALWTDLRREGIEYEIYNKQPMFRYNTYFGINTVHYLDLIGTTPGAPLAIFPIVKSALLTMIAKSGVTVKSSERVLNFFSEKLFNRLDSIKFLSFIDGDGYPALIPVLQCQAAGSNRLAFHPGAFGEELKNLKPGLTVAVFCMSMQMENVLVRGIFNGFVKSRGIELGTIDMDWVYNSMPPNHGQIYPPVPLKRVVNF